MGDSWQSAGLSGEVRTPSPNNAQVPSWTFPTISLQAIDESGMQPDEGPRGVAIDHQPLPAPMSRTSFTPSMPSLLPNSVNSWHSFQYATRPVVRRRTPL